MAASFLLISLSLLPALHGVSPVISKLSAGLITSLTLAVCGHANSSQVSLDDPGLPSTVGWTCLLTG